MSKTFALPAAVAVLAAGLVLSSAFATAAPVAPAVSDRIVVGYFVDPPFVVPGAEKPTGMAIELWESLAAAEGLVSDYQAFPTVRALVDATAAGGIDIAVTNLTITRVRAERVDFSQPWFDAGLRLMVRRVQTTGLWDVLAGLAEAGHLGVYLGLAAILAAATVLLTLFDRRFDKDFPKTWPAGLAENLHAVVSVTTTGRAVRRNPYGSLGRVLAAFWLIVGVGVVAYVTSSVTSVMTAMSVGSRIGTIADLDRHTVAVFSGSVAEDFAREEGLAVLAFPGLDASVAALVAGRVDALIADAPVLEYYLHTHPEASLDVVGALFQPDKYGFAFPPQSPLARRINVELLAAHESGALEALRNRYFGTEP